MGLKTFVNISAAQYLGPAVVPGAVYIGSTQDRCAEILCIKGNRATQGAGGGVGSAPVYAQPALNGQTRRSVSIDKISWCAA